MAARPRRYSSLRAQQLFQMDVDTSLQLRVSIVYQLREGNRDPFENVGEISMVDFGGSGRASPTGVVTADA